MKDKELSHNQRPRILCLDDYFMTEVEKTIVDPNTGRSKKDRVRFFNIYLISYMCIYVFQKKSCFVLCKTSRVRNKQINKWVIVVYNSRLWYINMTKI